MKHNSTNSKTALFFGEFEGGEYGNRFGGSIERDGQVSFEFSHKTQQDLTLYVQGYDIDYYGEVEVFLNGASIGYLTPGENKDLVGSSFEIAAEDILGGINEITFEVSGSHGRIWGVTDLILLNSGINVSTMAVDPEFSDDGWVTWQAAGKIYLGTYDSNSGALLEVVNESIGGVMPLYQSYQGPELFMTTDGPVALGISEAGIVYLDANDSYILEGTEGYRIGFLPKGEYDGLRFTMKPIDWWFPEDGEAEVYLWDNGDISRLEFGDPTTRPVNWLNESEAVIRSVTQMGVYNLDTGEEIWFADAVYQDGYIASIETTSGEKYIAMLHDDGFTDIWTESDTGWVLWRRLETPEEIFGQFLFSPELQEQSGNVYLIGISSERPTPNEKAAIVVYDFGQDTWAQITDVRDIVDPEIIPLENGGFSIYYHNGVAKRVEWLNVTPQDLVDLAVPGDAPPNWNYGWHREAPGWHLEYGWILELPDVPAYGWHIDWVWDAIWEWTYGEVRGWEYGWHKDWWEGWHIDWSWNWVWNVGGWAVDLSWTWDNGYWWVWDYGWDRAGDMVLGWQYFRSSWVYRWHYATEIDWYWDRTFGWVAEWDLGWYWAQGSARVWAPHDGWVWVYHHEAHWDYGSYFGWNFSAQGGWGWTYDYWVYVNNVQAPDAMT